MSIWDGFNLWIGVAPAKVFIVIFVFFVIFCACMGIAVYQIYIKPLIKKMFKK